MFRFQFHLRAIAAAGRIIAALPEEAVFALEVTEADCYAEPPVLNIFVPSHVYRKDYGLALHLGEVTDEGDGFTSYRVATSLLVSIITQEEKNNDD